MTSGTDTVLMAPLPRSTCRSLRVQPAEPGRLTGRAHRPAVRIQTAGSSLGAQARVSRPATRAIIWHASPWPVVVGV